MTTKAIVFKSCILVGLALSATAHAAIVFDSGVVSLTSNDATQNGRINRNAVASDWSTPKPYPGITSPTNVYHYRTFTFTPLPSGRYVQISLDDQTNSTTQALFASAYVTSYNASSLGTNYSGDAGSSLNLFNNSRYFQVLIPAGSTLVLVVNETTTNAGLGHNFRIFAESFADTIYNPPATDVSSQVRVTQNGFARNRGTGLWVARLTVANTSSTSIDGPVKVAFTNLPVTVTMANASGTTQFGGYPYITVSEVPIPAGASVTVTIEFTNPTNGYISFTPVTYSGYGL